MINNHSIALDNAVDSEVAAIAGIGDLSILKYSHSDFNGIHSRSTIPHDLHPRSRSASKVLLANANRHLERRFILIACLKMDVLVLDTVKSRACMDEDACNLVALFTTPGAEHCAGRGECVKDVKVVLSALGLCHSGVFSGELTVERGLFGNG